MNHFTKKLPNFFFDFEDCAHEFDLLIFVYFLQKFVKSIRICQNFQNNTVKDMHFEIKLNLIANYSLDKL